MTTRLKTKSHVALAEQLNGVEIIHPVERPSEDDPLLLSPVVVYSIDISDADLTEEECESDICTVEYEFLWLHEESCSSVLLCSKVRRTMLV